MKQIIFTNKYIFKTFQKIKNQELSSDEIFYVDHARAVKRYQRSDAGKEQPLPCDVRPPPILRVIHIYLYLIIRK